MIFLLYRTNSNGLCTGVAIVKERLKKNPTAAQMEEISAMRDKLIDMVAKPYCEDPDDDRWMAKPAVMQFSKRVPVFTTHMLTKFREFRRLASRDSATYSHIKRMMRK